MIAAASLAAALAVAAPAAAPATFVELRWTAPGAEFTFLTSQPHTCLKFEAEMAPWVQAGAALFNSPALLGGQAAKGGLSCANCHANGRDNAHFQMAGVSGRPGTADVTNSFFSASRGNARFDPVPIPDLAMPDKVSRDPAADALEPFIRTLIVEEFSGREPTPAMLAALAAYVRAVGVCRDGPPRTPRQLGDQLQLVDFAVRGAADMAERGDVATARALLAAARHQLELIAERYRAPSFRTEQRDLLAASRALQSLGGEPNDGLQFTVSAATWRALFQSDLANRLRAGEAKSLYNPDSLAYVAPQRDNR